MKRLFIFLLRSSLPGAEESNEAGRNGISLSCIQHIVVYTAYNWPARRDAGEADDLREREKPRLDDAQVGHWWQEQVVVDQQIRLGAIAFGLGTLIYTGLEFVHFFEVIFEHSPFIF